MLNTLVCPTQGHLLVIMNLTRVYTDVHGRISVRSQHGRSYCAIFYSLSFLFFNLLSYLLQRTTRARHEPHWNGAPFPSTRVAQKVQP